MGSDCRFQAPGVEPAVDSGRSGLHHETSPVSPDSRIVVLPHAQVKNGSTPEAADRAYRDAALESGLLRQRVDLIAAITKAAEEPGLFDWPFILDFDLDYLNTKKSIAPTDSSVFDGAVVSRLARRDRQRRQSADRAPGRARDTYRRRVFRRHPTIARARARRTTRRTAHRMHPSTGNVSRGVLDEARSKCVLEFVASRITG